ncbi:MAG: VCBS repeat-containing protein [Flavobacteriales bacterium]|nr:VCBS repeat-containing protein [Flavobacteriales bacterium]
MQLNYLGAASMLLFAGGLMAQPSFTNASSMLSNTASSGGCMAVVDMDMDGLDDIVQLDMSKHVYILYQNPDHTFTTFDYGQVDNSNQWGWAIADVDKSGHKDIMSGVSVTRFLKIDSRGVYNLVNLNGPNIFHQGVSAADMDGDSWIDLYACNDVGPNNIWINDGAGNLPYDATFIDWTTNPSSDMSGNYASVFTDFDDDGDIDLHISHCRQGVNDPADPRRWDRLFVNDGNGNYTDQALLYGLQNREQVWTTDFGDYDNDGDLDVFSTTHSTSLMLFENDGNGFYTNVTAGSGLENSTGFFLQGLFRDLDNDGFLDIMTGSADLYFKGNGDGTFTQINNLFPAAKDMHSFAFGDLNGDGFEDVYASYGDGYVDGDPSFPDRLWMNTPNGNHWLNVNLQGVQSNPEAIGGKVLIYGPWGVQVREVRSGESYGINNTSTCHFGLGVHTTVDSLVIRWPSGLVEHYTNIPADQSISVLEGVCISPTASITASGDLVVCTGGPAVTLTANPGFNYLWSTNETSQSIDVTQGGSYSVVIDDGTGCTGQAMVSVVQDPDETPTAEAGGDLIFCDGGSVVLTSSSASNYLWSTNETTQSITVDQAGTYSVSVDGVCGTFTSNDIVVDVLTIPAAPTTTGASIPVPGTADISATGSNVVWYDAATGGNEVGTGNSFTTPFLNTSTSFWASDENVFGGDVAFGGRTDITTTGVHHTNDGFYLVFEAYEPMTIKSVKVDANGAGDRDIALVDRNNGNAVVVQGTFTIPDGESRVQLDFEVPVAGEYGLRAISNNPQLWRDGLGSNPTYPYALGTMGAITGTNVTGGNTLEYYYFFYDWEVESFKVDCSSPRVETVVNVLSTGINDAIVENGVRVWPNPADNVLHVIFEAVQVDVRLFDMTGREVFARQADGGMSKDGSMDIDVGPLTPGKYVIQVRSAEKIVTGSVVIR